jgi:hypothetical protein
LNHFSFSLYGRHDSRSRRAAGAIAAQPPNVYKTMTAFDQGSSGARRWSETVSAAPGRWPPRGKTAPIAQPAKSAVKKRRTFGFVCPQFSVDVSASGFLLPRSRGATLAKRLLPDVATASVSGRYNITVHVGGAEACRLPALVAWARHRAGAGPFLAFNCRTRTPRPRAPRARAPAAPLGRRPPA